jgi:hypothetical protein
MISNWILDISIGCLLLISIGFFYDITVIFYPMFNWWMIIFLVPFAVVCNLIDRVQNTIYVHEIDNESKTLEYKYIKPAEQYNLGNSLAIAALWLVPIVVDLLFGSVAVFIAHLPNPNLNSDDVYLICLTPAIILWITCLSKKLRETLSNNINSSIYGDLGSIGVVANTFVVEWGGHSISKILGIVS